MKISRRFIAVAAVAVIAAITVVGVPSSAVAAPPWSDPVNVSAPGRDAFSSQIVVTGSGTLAAIWYRYDGSNDIVQSASSADAGATWSAPVNVSALGGDAEDPQIVVTGSGALVAIWSRLDGSNIVQSASSADAGATWSAPVNLSASGGDAQDPQIVVSGSGALTAIWYRYNVTNFIVQSASSTDAGATWSAPVNLSASGGNAGYPQIVVTGSGTLAAIWHRHNGSHYIVQSASSADAGATWSAPVNVSAPGRDAYSSQIVVTGSGTLAAIWSRYDGSNFIVQSASSTDAGATWSAPVNLSASGGNADYPQIVVTGSGTLTAIWHRYDGTNNIVQSASSADAGATWSAPVSVSASGGSASYPQIVVTGSGTLTAIWHRYDGSYYFVQSASSADAGATWSAPVSVSASGGNALVPQIVVTGSGTLAAIWHRTDGTNYFVQTSRLLAAAGSAPAELAETGIDMASVSTGLVAMTGLTLLGTVLLLGSRRRKARL